jgi:hypothetical protein
MGLEIMLLRALAALLMGVMNAEVLPEITVDIKILSLEVTASYWVEPMEEVATFLKNFKQKMLAF